MIGDKQNQKGTTLLEIVVAVGIFSVLMVILGGIVEGVSQSQRSAIAAQDTQESLRYAFEVISKELRQARKDNDNECDDFVTEDSLNRIFNEGTMGTNNALYFMNKNNDCVYYYLDVGRLKVRRIGLVEDNTYDATPDDINVSGLNFFSIDNLDGALPDDLIQPKVTINLQAESVNGKASEKKPLRVQTTISSRHYE